MARIIFISGSSSGLPTQALSVGASSYLSMPYADYAYAAAQHRALSLWINVTNTTGNSIKIGKVNEELLTIETSSSGFCRIIYTTHDSSGDYQSRLVTNSVISTGTYHHIFVDAWQKGSPYTRCYINGAEASYAINTTAAGETINNSGNPFLINSPGSAALIYQLAAFSDNTNGTPSITDLYDSGKKDVSAHPALYSLLDVSGGDVTNDAVLAASWTNNGSVTASSTIP